jgi:hypothetical protein
MCNYVSVINHEFDAQLVKTIRTHMTSSTTLSPDITWTIAARVWREIKARLESSTHNNLLAVMKLCLDWNAQQRR